MVEHLIRDKGCPLGGFLAGLHLPDLLEGIVARHNGIVARSGQDLLAGHVCFDFRSERLDLAILVCGLGFGLWG